LNGQFGIGKAFKRQEPDAAVIAEESLSAIIRRLECDANWHGGHYHEHYGVPETLARIRFQTLVHYGIHELLIRDFPDSAGREMKIQRMVRKWAPASLNLLENNHVSTTVAANTVDRCGSKNGG
jgi:hypothetical protein